MAGLLAKMSVGMKQYAIDASVMQMLGLVETAEPQIESVLRKSLRDMRAKHPQTAQVFLTNWTKINTAVQQELAAPQSFFGSGNFGSGKKRTRKASTRRSKKTQKHAV